MIQTIEKPTQYIINEKSKYNYGCETVIYKGKVLYSNAKNFEEYCEMKGKKFLLLNQAQFDIRADKIKKEMCKNWYLIDADRYNEMLEVLPPFKWRGSSFFISEATMDDLHTFFIQVGGLYYEGLQSHRLALNEIKTHLFAAIKGKTVKKATI